MTTSPSQPAARITPLTFLGRLTVLGLVLLATTTRSETKSLAGGGPGTATLPAAADNSSSATDTRENLLGGRVDLQDEAVKAFEATLLDMFALRTRPRPRNGVHIPEYMKELYRNQVEDPEGVSMNFRVRHHKSTSTANTVRAFHDQESHVDREGEAYENRRVLTFNVSTIPDREVLTAAELRLLRQEVAELAGREAPGGPELRQRINIYQVLRPAAAGGDEPMTRLIDSRVVDVRNSEWESFDVHPAVLHWRTTPDTNHGIVVEAVNEDGSRPRHRHVRTARSAAEATEGEEAESWSAQKPLLVTYSDDGRRAPRTKRQAGGGKKKNRRMKPSCKRHELYVDFSDVGWNDWIVAPPGYQAYFCHGECPFPIAAHLNTTNHAIVQTLVNSRNPSSVPKACCVPTELTPISMLYLDDYEKVVLKNYQDMVVEACGCR